MPKTSGLNTYRCVCRAKCGGLERKLSRYMYYEHQKAEKTQLLSQQLALREPGSHTHRDDSRLERVQSLWTRLRPNKKPQRGVHDQELTGENVDHTDEDPPDLLGTIPEDNKEAAADPFPATLALDSEALYSDRLAESTTSKIPELQKSLNFRSALEGASLDNGDLSEDQLSRLRDPQPTPPLKDIPRDLLMSLRLFFSTTTASDAVYENVRQDILTDDPRREIVSHKSVKRVIAELSGIQPIVHDMCPATCMAYAGPHADLDTCLHCGLSRMDPLTSKPRQYFYTMPLGPQLQARWSNPTKAHLMEHRSRETERIMAELKAPGSSGRIEEYTDVYHGREYLQAVNRGDIKPQDMTLMFSMDGAQLYEDKKSDCWMYIWVILDLPPEIRYKQSNVIVGGVIPGPNNPKDMESFLFPGFHHLAALQKESLKVYHGLRKEVVTSDIYLLLGSADGPGSTHFTGFVGHHGQQFCRQYCGLQGRHKPKKPQYYGALLKPWDYKHPAGGHPDIEAAAVSNPNPGIYNENLVKLLNAPNKTQYAAIRKDTGLSSTSIFSGLPSNRRLPIPSGFAGDCMHVANLNLGDLLIPLWRGSFQCDHTDDTADWDWAVLQGDIWLQHGAEVAACKQYMPGSYDRPPRNLAEKVSSGYKAKEWQNYFYGIAPALLYGILPMPYWLCFCKLVYAMRLLHQKKISRQHVREAHKFMAEFHHEFELLYVQRRLDRIHFVRPCLHALLHMASETVRLGPVSLFSTWTMERAVGYLGSQIRQPSNPYHNLSERGLRQCQLNALQLEYPDLVKEKSDQPQYSEDIGDGFVFLRARERTPHRHHGSEGKVLKEHFVAREAAAGNTVSAEWEGPLIRRWARLRLPNGQVARSAWKECNKSPDKVRRARMVKLLLNNQLEFAEVRFYFFGYINRVREAFALVNLCPRPDEDLFKKSSFTVWSVALPDDTGLQVISAKDIKSVVAAIPHTLHAGEPGEQQRLFFWEQFGLEIALWSEALVNPEDEADLVSPDTDE